MSDPVTPSEAPFRTPGSHGEGSRATTPTPASTTPASAAEVRSQAVAMLKRAASLPRKHDTRRPSRDPVADNHPVMTTAQQYYPHNQEAGPSARSFADVAPPFQTEHEETLSPSPVDVQYGHSGTDYSQHEHTLGGLGMQRSLSAASSFHSQSTPLRGTGLGGGATLTPEGGQQAPGSAHPAIGRNTPSPLPSLGDLRLLQRSNSQMARARAMEKLTGGRDTPDMDTPLYGASSSLSLQRAGTVGGTRMLGVSLNRGIPQAPAPASDMFAPATAFAVPRPRLQRSFTVSSSNMGKERRSAVGRRMVERLAERRAARDKEEAEVRQLWEERRAAADSQRPASTASQLEQPVADDDQKHQDKDEGLGDQEELDDQPSVPIVTRSSPTEPQWTDDAKALHPGDSLNVPDRSPSRSTTVSGDEAFEYESHLRRSLSGRTARGSDGVPSEAEPPVVVPNTAPPLRGGPSGLASSFTQALDHAYLPEPHDEEDWDLEPPRPAFATPTRRVPAAGAGARDRGGEKANSPGTDSIVSRDGFGSMMFVVDERGSEAVPNVPTSDMPVGVEEGGGSEWGTPRKHGTPSQGTGRAGSPTTPERYDPSQGDEQTPSGRRSSNMSWEEVGGEGDREVPSDQRYDRESGSVSARIGRTVNTVMRKRSTSRMSRSSAGASPPPSPSKGVAWGRRGSHNSGTSGHGGTDHGLTPMTPSTRDAAKHSSAISTATVSEGGHVQYLGEQVSENFPPVAPPNDPRLLSAKLSPFPGIANLEGGQRLFDGQLNSPPPLLSQNSDSIVPTQQRSTPAVANDIYALPLPPTTDDKRSSADSLGKRSWLAKAFGSATSPRSSGGTGGPSRKNSVADTANSSRKHSADAQASGAEPQHSGEQDPFAGADASLGAMSSVPPRMRARPASPTVSVVPEGSEDGSRFTRYTTNRDWADQEDHIIHEQEYEEKAVEGASPAQAPQLSQKSAEVLMRMNKLLSLAPDDPRRPDVLDDPPRKLLLATQVLQVVNVNTAKDRFLFLFNDILVITKPLITSGTTANLDMRFVVKSVVSLDKLQATGFSDESARAPERDALVAEFSDRFAQNPHAACQFLVERNRWKDDLANLAAVIFKTSELDKAMIGNLLAEQPGLLQAFLAQFQFVGTRIDDSLRSFLLALRLPDVPARSESLLRAFATRWHAANADMIQYTAETAFDLVLAIMQLNDAIHGGPFGFAMRNPALQPDVFISSFRSKDPRGLVSDHTLENIYGSISHIQLSQALSSEQAQLIRHVTLRLERLPAKLTYGQWSDPIEVALPGPDPDFSVHLSGQGLEFDVPNLSFDRSASASFRVRGTSLGSKSIIFNRVGPNAALYASLGNARVVNIERQYMKHTFHVAFANHLGVKRKYCFSVSDPSIRARWGTTLQRQIALQRQAKATASAYTSARDQLRRAADSVALRVLRDALIPPSHEHDSATPSGPRNKTDRAGSVSLAYQPIVDGEERGLGPLVPPQRGTALEGTDGMVECQSGKELVLLCRQNSLLPGVLELLQAGLEPSSGRPGMV